MRHHSTRFLLCSWAQLWRTNHKRPMSLSPHNQEKISGVTWLAHIMWMLMVVVFKKDQNQSWTSFTSTNVKLRLRFDIPLTFTWCSSDIHLTFNWPSPDPLWVELVEIQSKVAHGNLPQKCPKNDDSHTSEYLFNEIQLISADFSWFWLFLQILGSWLTLDAIFQHKLRYHH